MNDYYEVTTAPTGNPVEFTDASQWARGISTVDTQLTNSLIDTATAQIEKATNKVFISRSISGFFARLRESDFERFDFVEIRRAPVTSVTSVEVNGNVVPTADYIIKNTVGYTRILFRNTLDLDEEMAYPIKVNFTAGYGNASQVPNDIKVAIQQYVLYLYENRGDVSTDKEQQFPLVTRQIIRKNRFANGL